MNSLDDVFKTQETTPVIQSDIELVDHSEQIETNIESDYEITRTNLHKLLTQGQEAIVSALEVAKISEHPRAFEVVGGLMKQLADINHQLLDLSEKRQKLTIKPKTDTAQHVTNNAIFVGSTNELNKMLRDLTGGK